MTFQETFLHEVHLNEMEVFLKEYHLRHPERHLDLPHSVESCEDVLALATRSTSDEHIRRFLESSLSEDTFFHSGFDTELYRHVRYLPANWHSHSFFEIACVVEGQCVNYFKNHELHMKKGDVCIIAPETPHAVSVFSDDTVLINIVLRISSFESAFFSTLANEDTLSDFFTKALYHSSSHSYLMFSTGGDPAVFDFVLYAYQEFNQHHQYKGRFLNNLVNAFFIMLLRNHGTEVTFAENGSMENHEYIVLILKYIQENYTTVTLKELSSLFSYSERQLQRIIKSCTGSSFLTVVQKLKMREAERLLKRTDIPIHAIAEKLGYQDIGNFRHVFEKYYDVTPAEYRGSSG
jgi:AraC-like DNA-binding protein/mannose-6-phosphate isomerase-like protein (cupin superfamily)